MCTYLYLHHHHIDPCTRPIDFVVHYKYCSSATTDPSSGQLQPCQNLSYDPGQVIDYENPCASGGCLASPECSSGACRLEELNCLWICFRCNLGGNTYRYCCHPMRRSPDTFCYHVCCETCRPDGVEES